MNQRLVWTLGNDQTLSWNTFGAANLFRFERETQTNVELGPAYPYGHFGFRRRDAIGSLRTEAAWSRQWNSGASLETSFSLNAGKIQRDRSYTAASPQGDALLARDYDSRPDSSGGAATGKFSWPARNDHTLSAGWDAARSSQREREIQRDLLAVDAGPMDFDRRTDARLRRFAVYAQDEWNPGRGFALYAGLRRESSSTRTTGSDVAATANHMSLTSPTVQALWKLQDEPRRQLRAALAASYKAPELQQLAPRRFASLLNSEVEPDRIGNPGLRPETVRCAQHAALQCRRHAAPPGTRWQRLPGRQWQHPDPVARTGRRPAAGGLYPAVLRGRCKMAMALLQLLAMQAHCLRRCA
ncbi:TonB-dependent receptor plug domain-containing protein [Pseudoduganella violaceinigra]|uniref:TonB-dependent receptor plug domain-containing protein n=1 Tax=Pseudoduganella violaceinigra TaxID=246602 RepID=UPI00040A6CCC|nr:TonB-dependent receptor [Pseudoduganella violaceinigra]